MKFMDILKILLFVVIIASFAPVVIQQLKEHYSSLTSPKTKVAFIKIEGTLSNASDYTKYLKKFFKDTSIKAILLKIESGGGASGTSQAIFNDILELKKEHLKPIIVFSENICASGAYYIATAADSIITSPSAIVGSIGVFIPHPEIDALLQRFDVRYTIIKTGAYKGLADPLLKDTPEQINLLQGITNDTYEQFTHDVAQQRKKLSLKAHKEWADGKIFTGRQAEKLGLIDAIGSSITVENEIKKRIAVPGEIEWVQPPEPSALQRIFSHFSAKTFAQALVSACTEKHLTPHA